MGRHRGAPWYAGPMSATIALDAGGSIHVQRTDNSGRLNFQQTNASETLEATHEHLDALELLLQAQLLVPGVSFTLPLVGGTLDVTPDPTGGPELRRLTLSPAADPAVVAVADADELEQLRAGSEEP